MAVWHIPGNTLGWLWPAMALLGISLQLAAVWKGRRLWLLAGFLLLLAGGVAESDITLIIGDLSAGLALWLMLSRK